MFIYLGKQREQQLQQQQQQQKSYINISVILKN
jgi:hypothetical protein